MGWGGGGLLTKKMDKGKRDKLVIFFDILAIVAFLLFAVTQRASYEQGYQSCFTQICGNPYGGVNKDSTALGICWNIAEAQAEKANMTAQAWIEKQYPEHPPCLNTSVPCS